jgi:hypothetical protein
MAVTTEKLDALLESYLNRVIDPQTYARKQNELHAERSTLQDHIKTLETNHDAWLEPLASWIKRAKNIRFVVKDGRKDEVRRLALEIFGSNLTLVGKTLRGEAVKPWSLLPKTGINLCLVTILTVARQLFGNSRPVDSRALRNPQ